MLNAQEHCLTLTIRSLAKFISAAIMLFLCSNLAMASCVCKPSTEDIGECTWDAEVCGCLKKTEWEYGAKVELERQNAVFVVYSCRAWSRKDPRSALDDAVSGMFMNWPQFVNRCFPRSHTQKRWENSERGQASCVECRRYKQYTEDIGECQVKIEFTGCFGDIDLTISAKVEEVESGKTASSSDHEIESGDNLLDTEDDAADDAISELVRRNPELDSKCFPS